MDADVSAVLLNATNGTCVIVATPGTLYCACAVLVLVLVWCWRAFHQLWSRLDVLEATEKQLATDMAAFAAHLMSQLNDVKRTQAAGSSKSATLQQSSDRLPSSTNSLLNDLNSAKPTCRVAETSAVVSQETFDWLSSAARVTGVAVPWWVGAAFTGAARATKKAQAP